MFPFTDLTSAKRRPAMVASPDTFNSNNEDLVLVAVTSQVTQAGPAVLVGPGDVEAGVLPKDSIARVAKPFTLHSSLVVKRICRLTPTKKDELPREPWAFF